MDTRQTPLPYDSTSSCNDCFTSIHPHIFLQAEVFTRRAFQPVRPVHSGFTHKARWRKGNNCLIFLAAHSLSLQQKETQLGFAWDTWNLLEQIKTHPYVNAGLFSGKINSNPETTVDRTPGPFECRSWLAPNPPPAALQLRPPQAGVPAADLAALDTPRNPRAERTPQKKLGTFDWGLDLMFGKSAAFLGWNDESALARRKMAWHVGDMWGEQWPPLWGVSPNFHHI